MPGVKQNATPQFHSQGTKVLEAFLEGVAYDDTLHQTMRLMALKPREDPLSVWGWCMLGGWVASLAGNDDFH